MRFRQILEIGQLNQLSVFIVAGQDLEMELGQKNQLSVNMVF